MSWMNRQVPGVLTFPISSVAANAETEKCLVELSKDIQIVSARFTNDTAMATDSTSGFVLALINEGTAGTLGQTVASFNGDTVSDLALAATQSVELSLSTATGATEIDAGEVLAWKETTIGTGTARSNGYVTIEYVIV